MLISIYIQIRFQTKKYCIPPKSTRDASALLQGHYDDIRPSTFEGGPSHNNKVVKKSDNGNTFQFSPQDDVPPPGGKCHIKNTVRRTKARRIPLASRASLNVSFPISINSICRTVLSECRRRGAVCENWNN